jgi:hypothetical protein
LCGQCGKTKNKTENHSTDLRGEIVKEVKRLQSFRILRIQTRGDPAFFEEKKWGADLAI